MVKSDEVRVHFWILIESRDELLGYCRNVSLSFVRLLVDGSRLIEGEHIFYIIICIKKIVCKSGRISRATGNINIIIKAIKFKIATNNY